MSGSFTANRKKGHERRGGELSDLKSILGKLPTVVLPIRSLLIEDSPRQSGENDEHVRLLAESEEQLPPIVVHGQSMRVIDGIHRIRAAVACGKEKIEAKIYHNTEDNAFVLAVQMNIAHGLPLTRADRMAAAVRIIESHPQWSDRMIATVTGLSAGTVGKVRRRSTVHNAPSTTRIGRDGRVRPIDGAAGRQKAGELLAKKPSASIRNIAKEAGVSPSTVHDVRQRLSVGLGPVPKRRRDQQITCDALAAAGANIAVILASLQKDPSLRFSDAGRSLLRWLDRYHVEMANCKKIAEMVPNHCAGSVAKLARSYAWVWTELAAYLEQRSP